MSIAPLLAAAAAFIIAATLLWVLWDPVSRYVETYNAMLPYYDNLGASIIAGAGGQRDRAFDVEFEGGMDNHVHTQLGLKQAEYSQGILFNGLLYGAAATPFLIAFLGAVTGLVFGLICVVIIAAMLDFLVKDAMKRSFIRQARKFPFFLDIFLLTVQSGGHLHDAIRLYNQVYDRDPLGRELAILAETSKSYDDVESFKRLSRRVGDKELKNMIGELSQKIKSGGELKETLQDQSDDMRQMREEHAAKVAESLNAKYMFCVVFATVATFLVVLSVPLAYIFGSNLI